MSFRIVIDSLTKIGTDIVNFIPNPINGLIILAVGYLLAWPIRWVVGTVLRRLRFDPLVERTGITGSLRGLSYADRVGRVVQYLISVFVVILALAVLGIDTALPVTAFTITLAAFALALGLALGLGARPVVFQILASYYLRSRLPAGRTITVNEARGEVANVGSVNTLLTTPDEELIIPNGQLFDTLVRLSRPAPTEDPRPSDRLNFR